jgi:hypothetical protein
LGFRVQCKRGITLVVIVLHHYGDGTGLDDIGCDIMSKSEIERLLRVVVEKIEEHHERWKRAYSPYLYDARQAAREALSLLEKVGEVHDAATRLYYAAHWTADRPVNEAELWEGLRDALGLELGHAPKPNKEPPAEPCKHEDTEYWIGDEAKGYPAGWYCRKCDALVSREPPAEPCPICDGLGRRGIGERCAACKGTGKAPPATPKMIRGSALKRVEDRGEPPVPPAEPCKHPNGTFDDGELVMCPDCGEGVG